MIDITVLPAKLPPIKTQQGPITLERLHSTHAQMLYEAGLEAAGTVQPWMGKTLCPTSLRAANLSIKALEKQRSDGYGITYLLCFNGECFGMGLLNAIHPVHAVANLGYWLRPSACGKGLGMALCNSLIHLAFSQMHLVRLELFIEPNNSASIGLAKRLGAHKEGLCRKRVYGRDAFLYSLVV